MIKVKKSSKQKVLSRGLLPVLVMVGLFVLPMVMLGQNPGDPGDNPDGRPPAVPLEPWMSMILVAAGAILSVWVIKRRNAKKADALVAQTVADSNINS